MGVLGSAGESAGANGWCGSAECGPAQSREGGLEGAGRTMSGRQHGSGCRWTLRDVTSEEGRGGSVYLSVLVVARHDGNYYLHRKLLFTLEIIIYIGLYT
jgi:hypothetical protein